MNNRDCYNLCCKYHGKVVRIHDTYGKTHFGKITDITEESVWFEPISKRKFNGGFGYGPRFSDEDIFGFDGFDGFDRFDRRSDRRSHRRSDRRSHRRSDRRSDRRSHRRSDRRSDRRFDRRFDRFDGFAGGAAVELAFGFIVGISLAALFFF